MLGRRKVTLLQSYGAQNGKGSADTSVFRAERLLLDRPNANLHAQDMFLRLIPTDNEVLALLIRDARLIDSEQELLDPLRR